MKKILLVLCGTVLIAALLGLIKFLPVVKSEGAKEAGQEGDETVCSVAASADLTAPTPLPLDTDFLISEILHCKDNNEPIPDSILIAVNQTLKEKKSDVNVSADNLPQRPYPDWCGRNFPDLYFRSDLEDFCEKYHNYMHFTTYKEIHLKPGEIIEVPLVQTSLSIFSEMTPLITCTEYDNSIIGVWPIEEFDKSRFDDSCIDVKFWNENLRAVSGVPEVYPLFRIFYSTHLDFVVEAKAPGTTSIHVYGIHKPDETDPLYDYLIKKEFTVIDVYVNICVEEQM